jgi:hypothetical protein
MRHGTAVSKVGSAHGEGSLDRFGAGNGFAPACTQTPGNRSLKSASGLRAGPYAARVCPRCSRYRMVKKLSRSANAGPAGTCGLNRDPLFSRLTDALEGPMPDAGDFPSALLGPP